MGRVSPFLLSRRSGKPTSAWFWTLWRCIFAPPLTTCTRIDGGKFNGFPCHVVKAGISFFFRGGLLGDRHFTFSWLNNRLSTGS